MSASPRPRLLIVGLDGATFDNLLPWIEGGQLPTFRRLLDRGARGALRSTFPPVTAPAWTSFMTGKGPGRHGLYHFVEPVPSSYELRYTNARSRKAKTLWDLVGEGGLETGVINVPMTYPPSPVRGYMISGMDAPEGSRAITSPPALYDEIEQRLGRVSVQIRYLGYLKTDERRDALLDSLRDMDEHYAKLTRDLLARRPVDVAMVVFTSTDTVQHFFYQYLDPAHPQHDAEGARKYKDAILDVYRRLDGILAELSREVGEDTAIVLMSDHGFRSTSGRVVHLNRFLEEEGVLRRRSRARAWYHPGALLKPVLKHADALLRSSLGPGAKARIAALFPNLRRRWEAQYSGVADIDWAGTQAWCYEVLTFPPGIWINTVGQRPQGTVQPGADYDALLRRLTDRLLALSDPRTGQPLITKVYRKEEIYSGPELQHAPDLTVSWWEGVTFLTRPSFGEGEIVEYVGGRPLDAGEWGGAHDLDGIVTFSGKDFRPGTVLTGANIVDVAPTLLHLLGLKVPADMDGRVLEDAFTPAFLASHPVARREPQGPGPKDPPAAPDDATYSDDEQAEVEARLRGLGYIG